MKTDEYLTQHILSLSEDKIVIALMRLNDLIEKARPYQEKINTKELVEV